MFFYRSSINNPQKEEGVLPFLEAQKNLRKVKKPIFASYDAPKPWNKPKQKEMDVTKPSESKLSSNDLPAFTENETNKTEDDVTPEIEVDPKTNDSVSSEKEEPLLEEEEEPVLKKEEPVYEKEERTKSTSDAATSIETSGLFKYFLLKYI